MLATFFNTIGIIQLPLEKDAAISIILHHEHLAVFPDKKDAIAYPLGNVPVCYVIFIRLDYENRPACGIARQVKDA